MSSTNRGTVRQIADYYATPVPAIQAFLAAWSADTPPGLSCRIVLDPCAGGTEGREGMSYPIALGSTQHLLPQLDTIDTMDIRDDSCADMIGDYLTRDFTEFGRYDLIITNPPFNIACEVIEKALREVADGGYVVMLLRLNFLGSMERLRFWQHNPPLRIYVHAQRMGFLRHRTDLPPKLRNATDSIEYAHFVWGAGRISGPTLLKVI